MTSSKYHLGTYNFRSMDKLRVPKSVVENNSNNNKEKISIIVKPIDFNFNKHLKGRKNQLLLFNDNFFLIVLINS